MKRMLGFWQQLGLISRLMLAVGVAIVAGGGVQTALLKSDGELGFVSAENKDYDNYRKFYRTTQVK